MCAMYGAGLSTGCVVDVGEERSHICCVEDGMSNPNTRSAPPTHCHTHPLLLFCCCYSIVNIFIGRLTVQYGGNDITRLLYWLLKKVCKGERENINHLYNRIVFEWAGFTQFDFNK